MMQHAFEDHFHAGISGNILHAQLSGINRENCGSSSKSES